MRPTLDMRKAEKAFNAGVNYASKLTGFDKRKIILAEVGSILKACAGETKTANLRQVQRGAVLRALRGSGLTRGGQFTVNAGIKVGAPFGRVFMLKRGGSGTGYRRTHDENFKPATNPPGRSAQQHYRDSDWLALKQVVALAKEKARRALARAPESVALARGSWVLIADSVGIKLEEVPGGRISASAIQKARLSRAYKDQQRNNGTSVIVNTPGIFSVTMINRYPGADKLAFQRLLAFKVAGRAQFLIRACRKGYDGSLAQTAKLFPGWVVKTSTGN